MVGGIWGQTRCLGDRSFALWAIPNRRSGGPSRPGRPDMGTDAMPVYLSGTFNVQRPTLNVQEGDRKGARWAGYGDRHEI